MIERTNNRKIDDLRLLFEEQKKEPDNPRNLYYIAETYLCLKDWDNAYSYYEQRSKAISGFSQEVQDSLYKMAVIANFNLNYVWRKCEQLYLNCFEYDKNRAESLYMIGYHYTNSGDNTKAYKYLKRAFIVSQQYVPTTMNSKYKINQYDLPKLLLPLCYKFKDYELGLSCAHKCNTFENNDDKTNNSSLTNQWLSIFYLISESVKYDRFKNKGSQMVCFIAPGGWDKWDGETLETRGLGGSETCIIRFAENMAKLYSNYNVVITCNCETSYKEYKNVTYIQISEFPQFVATYKIDYCFINRYPEYIPVCIKNNIPNIYLMLHDFLIPQTIIPISDNLKNIICLSNYHKDHVRVYFPMFKDKLSVMTYGIEVDTFPVQDIVPYSFIYPSFPNRGLIPLLQMFPKIVAKYPQATLNVFCDTKMDWVQKNFPKEMALIDQLLQQPNVTNHGWVSESVLKRYWSSSHIWLYPCTFKETYCRVALEAAASKTLAITCDLAALNETVGDRGIIIKGDASTNEWQDICLEKLFEILDTPEGVYEQQKYINKNYEWACNRSYENVLKEFSDEYILWYNYNNVLQIGSHVGNTDNDPIFKKVHENTRLILVEPVPYLFKKLKENYNRKFPNNNFIFINKAVSNYVGEIILTIPSQQNDFSKFPSWASQLASINPDHIKSHSNVSDLITEQITVETTTINQIIDEYGITELDLLHTDTESHDYDILMDFNFKIKPSKIQFEHAHMDGFLQTGEKYSNLLAHFNEHGYKVVSANNEDTTLRLK